MLKLSLCDYSDVYALVKGTKTVVGLGLGIASSETDRKDKQVILKNCTASMDCISELNNKKLDNVKDFDFVMTMHNLIQNSNDYSKTSSSL